MKLLYGSNFGTNLDGSGEFAVKYDYLVVALEAKRSTFNTPGVKENCHFLKVCSCSHARKN
ncbi:putative NADH:ubiquinone reductase (non-electrogenic) [Dioscorea sansibarensis]